MRALPLFTIVIGVFMVAFTGPKKYYNNKNTDYRWYSNKYNSYWEPADTVIKLPDTIYTYKLGAQYFAFNQNGKLIINNNPCR